MKKIGNDKKIRLISNSYFAIGVILILLGTTIIILAKYPQVWYSLEINTVENEFKTLTKNIEDDLKEYEEKKKEEEERQKREEEKQPKNILPPLDLSLPMKNYLHIDGIGINAEIYDGEDYEKLLEQGIWRVYDFGTPENERVTILSSHRFGHFSWTKEQRDTQSFFHLPSTRVGDKIEIVWNQRKYVYEIFKLEEGTDITDYSADLILYTCKLYNSPVRIFRYAQRIN